MEQVLLGVNFVADEKPASSEMHRDLNAVYFLKLQGFAQWNNTNFCEWSKFRYNLWIALVFIYAIFFSYTDWSIMILFDAYYLLFHQCDIVILIKNVQLAHVVDYRGFISAVITCLRKELGKGICPYCSVLSWVTGVVRHMEQLHDSFTRLAMLLATSSQIFSLTDSHRSLRYTSAWNSKQTSCNALVVEQNYDRKLGPKLVEEDFDRDLALDYWILVASGPRNGLAFLWKRFKVIFVTPRHHRWCCFLYGWTLYSITETTWKCRVSRDTDCIHPFSSGRELQLSVVQRAS